MLAEIKRKGWAYPPQVNTHQTGVLAALFPDHSIIFWQRQTLSCSLFIPSEEFEPWKLVQEHFWKQHTSYPDALKQGCRSQSPRGLRSSQVFCLPRQTTAFSKENWHSGERIAHPLGQKTWLDRTPRGLGFNRVRVCCTDASSSPFLALCDVCQCWAVYTSTITDTTEFQAFKTFIWI